MKELTKACNLTAEEIKILITRHGFDMGIDPSSNKDSAIERINYLNKRLKAFNEVSANG